MARQVEAVAGARGIVLPGGWVLDGGDQIVISDAEWAVVEADEYLMSMLSDLGDTTLPAPVAPTFRDIQRVIASDASADIATLQAELDAHEADTTMVHGITDTSKLAWIQQTDVSAAVAGNVLTKDSDSVWRGRPVPAEYRQEVYYTTPSLVWAYDHNQNSYAISAETFDANGRRYVGNVTNPTPNRIEIQWYFPMTGKAVFHA